MSHRNKQSLVRHQKTLKQEAIPHHPVPGPQRLKPNTRGKHKLLPTNANSWDSERSQQTQQLQQYAQQLQQQQYARQAQQQAQQQSQTETAIKQHDAGSVMRRMPYLDGNTAASTNGAHGQ